MNFYLINDFLKEAFHDERFLFYYTWYYLFVILIEAAFLTMAGYKNFGWSFLYSFLANTASFATFIWYNYTGYFKPFALETAFLYYLGLSVIIEFFVLLIFIWKSRFVNLLTGVLLANLISAIMSVVGLVAKLFYFGQ